MGPEAVADDLDGATVAGSSARSPTIATSATGATAKSRAMSHWAKNVGWRGATSMTPAGRARRPRDTGSHQSTQRGAAGRWRPSPRPTASRCPGGRADGRRASRRRRPCRRSRHPGRRSGRGSSRRARAPRRTSAHRRSPRTGRAGLRRGPRSPRGRRRPIARPSFQERRSRPSAVRRPAEERVRGTRRDPPVALGGIGIDGREGRRGIGERRDREPVPGRQRLVVAGRLGPFGPPREEDRPSRGEPRATSARVEPEPRATSWSNRTRLRIVVSSQLPAAVTPYARRTAPRGRRRPARTARTSAAVQVNVAPSTPSVSASRLAANVPSGRTRSRVHEVEDARCDVRISPPR